MVLSPAPIVGRNLRWRNKSMTSIELLYSLGGVILGGVISPYLKRIIENTADFQFIPKDGQAQMKSIIANDIDKQLLRLLVKVQYAIKKESMDYDFYGCGSAFKDVSELINYLVKFEVRYKKDKNARQIIELHKDFDNLDKNSESYRRLEEPEYYRIINIVYKCSDKILNKRFPQWK